MGGGSSQIGMRLSSLRIEAKRLDRGDAPAHHVAVDLGLWAWRLVLAAGAVALGGNFVLFWVYSGPEPFPGFKVVAVFGPPTLVYVVSALAFLRRPTRLITRRFLALGTSIITTVCLVLVTAVAASRDLPAAVPALGYNVGILTFPVAALAFFAVVPDGRYQRRFERYAVRGSFVFFLLVPLLVASSPYAPSIEFTTFLPRIVNPWYVPELSWLIPATNTLLIVSRAGVAVGALLLILKYRRLHVDQRPKIKGLMLATSALAAVMIVDGGQQLSGILDRRTYNVVLPLMVVPVGMTVPIALAVAIFRHGLLDLDVAIRRSMVYGALSMLIVVLYASIAAIAGLAASQRLPVAIAVLLTVAVAIGFQPARRALDRLASRLVFGDRLSGYDVVSRFGRMLEEADTTSELLQRLAEVLCQGLDLRWVRVAIAAPRLGGVDFEVVGAAGPATEAVGEPVERTPMTHAGELVGVIECGPKSEGELSPGDRELLATVARQAALAVRSDRMAVELARRLGQIREQAAELAASRERIVQAQDAERRRIERNIHDGVQQQLSALIAQARLARNQMQRSPTTAERTISELQAAAGILLDDLRELSHGIYPAVLSDRGLVEAIEVRADLLPIELTVHAAPELRRSRLRSDIEGAAYFMVSESLANAVKHGGAREADVRIARRNNRLVVEVCDYGRGFIHEEASGTGLSNLCDRIEAIGGRLEIHSRPGEGTTISADLPYVAAAGPVSMPAASALRRIRARRA